MKVKVNRKNELLKILFFCFVVGIFFFALSGLPRLALPLGVAYIIGLIIRPGIPALTKFGIKRSIAVTIVFTGFLFITVYPLVKMVPSLSEELQKVQYYWPKIETYINTEFQTMRDVVGERFGISIDENYLDDGTSYIKNQLTSFIIDTPKIVASVLEWILLVPLLLFFLLKDGPQFRKTLLKIIPNSIFERFYGLSYEFNKKLGDYILAKFIEASIVFLIITGGLFFMGVRFSFLLGLAAGVSNIIPYVGPILGMVPAIIFALVEYGISSTMFGGIVLLYVIANAVDIGLVFPILVSKVVDLHPVLVVGSVIVGSHYMGVLGMVVCIPLAAALKLIILEVYKEIYLGNSSS